MLLSCLAVFIKISRENLKKKQSKGKRKKRESRYATQEAATGECYARSGNAGTRERGNAGTRERGKAGKRQRDKGAEQKSKKSNITSAVKQGVRGVCEEPSRLSQHS